MWEIVNVNNWRWGRDTYATRKDAENELKSFWKGVHGVDLKKFTIRQVTDASRKALSETI